ncbi:DUF934 domain-containing protein [Aliishimia ponticola]|uniref:DUF934 domain-containing protein n=1 Tax=Aliishimia ponticola TaxID=2499833 RepID=A0A4S4NRI3_9RHOB|nr:DUF934 domain-containing protein [Aliishimia ponticola]THH38830.1 DUF934 domain-containing protein [Aliishimia ponticola]
MTQLINDSGFVADDWTEGFFPVEDAPANAGAIDVASDADPNTVPLTAPMVRIAFPSSADGRGFTIARMLRLRGYTGRLRAHGHVIADQYAMARRVGFDEVEVTDEIAQRQPEAQWQFRADWQAHDYQARLRG